MKEKFWQYLKDNHIWLFIGFNIIVLGFFTYWIVSSGWEESKGDIISGFAILAVVWMAYMIGTYVNWRKL